MCPIESQNVTSPQFRSLPPWHLPSLWDVFALVDMELISVKESIRFITMTRIDGAMPAIGSKFKPFRTKTNNDSQIAQPADNPEQRQLLFDGLNKE